MENKTIIMNDLPTIDWWGNGVVAYPDNEMMQSGSIPNKSLLIKQHQNLINAIKKLGYSVKLIPFPKQLEDLFGFDFVFSRDHFICGKNKVIVICNLRHDLRSREICHAQQALSKLPYAIKTLSTNEHVTEGGEFIYLPNENILLSGNSRNNLIGAEKTAEFLEVDSLHIIASKGYHLDTVIMPLFNEDYECIGIISAAEMFELKQGQILKSLCKQYNWESLSKFNQSTKESLRGRAIQNFLSLPAVIISGGELLNERAMEFIRKNNIRFHTCDVSQFNLSGGSIHCLTNELF